MEQLSVSPFIIGTPYLLSLHSSLADLSRDLVVDPTERPRAPLYAGQILAILFDTLCQDCLHQLEEDALHSYRLSEKWGRNGGEQYRIVENAYVTPAHSIMRTREEYVNTAKDNGTNRFSPSDIPVIGPCWFLSKIHFPALRMMTNFISAMEQADPSEKERHLRALKLAARERLASSFYQDSLPKPVLAYFQE